MPIDSPETWGVSLYIYLNNSVWVDIIGDSDVSTYLRILSVY